MHDGYVGSIDRFIMTKSKIQGKTQTDYPDASANAQLAWEAPA
ncbi:MAG TPA: hypothetical protein VI727_02075 [Candidatus Brocadiaceae bacterium]|nr:hypothetical protein [Candidatus Brocadiaceae bacterium]